MRHKRYDCNFGCPVEACLEVVGGKWKGVVLFQLLGGTKRFNELMRTMPKVTQRMLTRQLRELEADGIIQRKIFPEVPPKVEYSLTDFGRTLEPILRMLQKWGMEHLDQIIQARNEAQNRVSAGVASASNTISPHLREQASHADPHQAVEVGQ